MSEEIKNKILELARGVVMGNKALSQLIVDGGEDELSPEDMDKAEGFADGVNDLIDQMDVLFGELGDSEGEGEAAPEEIQTEGMPSEAMAGEGEVLPGMGEGGPEGMPPGEGMIPEEGMPMPGGEGMPPMPPGPGGGAREGGMMPPMPGGGEMLPGGPGQMPEEGV